MERAPRGLLIEASADDARLIRELLLGSGTRILTRWSTSGSG